MNNPLIMMALMFGLFYFMLIRPQRKKDKAVKDFAEQVAQELAK